MPTFILIHAAFHGGWVWRRVEHELVAMGRRVVAPSLNDENAREPATLSSHVREVVRLLSILQDQDAVLVAHSYGGLIATQAAARAAAKVKALVFVDAILPRPGASFLEIIPDHFRRNYLARRINGARRVVMPAPDRVADLADREDRDFVKRHLSPQPLATFEETVDRNLSEIPPPMFYLHCSAHSVDTAAGLYAPFAADAATRFGWRYRDLPIGLYGMVSEPKSLARALVETVDGVTGGLPPDRLQKVIDAIAKAQGALSIVDLARIADRSAWHFARSFKASVGISPHRYVMQQRTQIAARLLRESNLSISDIAAQTGFSSASRFSTAFRAVSGASPSRFRSRPDHGEMATAEPRIGAFPSRAAQR